MNRRQILLAASGAPVALAVGSSPAAATDSMAETTKSCSRQDCRVECLIGSVTLESDPEIRTCEAICFKCRKQWSVETKITLVKPPAAD